MRSEERMTIAFGNDHAGYIHRKEVLAVLNDLGITVIDLGSDSPQPIDFPLLTREVCRTVINGKAQRGLLLCGTGLGSAMAANRFKGIRAGVCHDTYSAHQGVEHDDMNVMCLGAQIVGPWLMKDLISAFLNARFDGTEDVVRRVGQLEQSGVDINK